MTTLYSAVYREILFFCAAFWREYSCICGHYVLRFTSFCTMLSPGNFKLPLALMVKKKRTIRFECLPEFKCSERGEQDVVGQGSFRAVFMIFDVVVKNLKLDLSLGLFNVEKGKHILLLLPLLLLLLKVARNISYGTPLLIIIFFTCHS